MVWFVEDRNKFVSVEILGFDKVKFRLCYFLCIEKVWISLGLLFGLEFINILFRLLDYVFIEGIRGLYKLDFFCLFLF